MAKRDKGKSKSVSVTREDSSGQMEVDSNAEEDGRGERGTREDEKGWVLPESPAASDWGDMPRDHEWTVEDIVDHYIPLEGERFYKVAWADWKGRDGRNTSWQRYNAETLGEELVGEYNLLRKAARKKQAKKTGGIPALLEQDINPNPLLNSTVPNLCLPTVVSRFYPGSERHTKKINDMQNMWTASLAETEKMILHKYGPDPLLNQALRISPEIEDDDSEMREAGPTTPQSLVGDRGPSLVIDELDFASPTTSLERPLAMASLQDDQSEASTSSENSNAKPESESEFDPEETRQPSGWKRVIIQRRWNEAIEPTGAASLTIYEEDDSSDDDCPRLPRAFNYLEYGYTYTDAVDVAKPTKSSDGIGCHCEIDCDVSGPAVCACQSHSDFNEQFAYDRTGRFLSNNKDADDRDAEVFECTTHCRCGASCPNRSTQKPRDVPLEVFKTRACGWGVRTVIGLNEGKVLGTFTGTLITRERAERLEQSRRREWAEAVQEVEDGEEVMVLDRRGYIFDLDCREVGDAVQLSPGSRSQENYRKYSVDAWAVGNWTRFLNHSCRPNLKVYTAIVDPYNPDNPPAGRLVFVTTRKVRAGDELTIDYNPRLEDMGKGKKRKVKVRKNLNVRALAFAANNSRGEDEASDTADDEDDGPNEIRCDCDEPNCRGFIRI